MNDEITFSLFLSIRALNSILRSRSYRNMILNRNVSIFLDASAEELSAALGDNIEESYIGDFLVSKCCSRFYLANEMIAGILDNPALFCRFPFSLFVLAISRVDAKRIRDLYGVLCYSDQTKLRLSPLRFQKTTFCQRGAVGRSWASILEELSSFPKNTIIVNDRYLMLGKEEQAEQNIADIASALMPSAEYDGELKMFVYFDAVNEKWAKDFVHGHGGGGLKEMNAVFCEAVQEEFQKKATKIRNAIHSAVNGDYKVKTICTTYVRPLEKARNGDVLMSTWVEGYDLTHNRRIITDYFEVSADYGLIAFDKAGRAEKEQTIVTKGLYCEGLNDSSDIPEERHRVMLSNYAFNMNYDRMLLAVDGTVVKDSDQVQEYLQQIPLFTPSGEFSGTARIK